MAKLPSGELENQVLGVLWADGGALTPRDVHDALGAPRGLAYTTTMTILVRLWRKGLLARERSGRSFAYRPKISQEERAAARMSEVLASSGDHSLALNHFVQSLPADQLSELRDVIKRTRAKR
jgi:predicted transcriptional regulator